MNVRITITLDGNIEDQMALEIGHDATPAAPYDYGATAFADVPDAVAGALEEVCEEIRQLAGLDPAERTQDKAQNIWEAIDAGSSVVGALRSLLAAHRTGSDADIARAIMPATEALADHDKKVLEAHK